MYLNHDILKTIGHMELICNLEFHGQSFKAVVQMLPIGYKELILIYLKTQSKTDVNSIMQMQ